ncbi:sigma-70 family RNA polymerase sigma factor [Brevibacterium pigmentatum]|uniref:sigma-70 family RNA polymerase sigma factor n=1 Tax=Brevibacterium pigmentatum TaxID=1496080 RepID=UPI00141F0465|nr:sigma-70 family RNA polymerase sigma factor [Brevibacterium pigmentatum]
MDKNEHLPGDSLADFTEDELFSLIDVGSSGAFSEFYRRHIASATVLAAADSANPRSRADAAFLAILKSLLDGTADRSSGFTALIRDEIVRSSDSDSAASSSELTEAEPEDLSSFAVIASAFSSLPDNWQRILWLREVEGQSAQSAAELLDITSATADRLTARAREELESTWTQTRPADGPLSIADRAELIPALLTSPILIERLSDTFVAAPGPDLDAEAAAAESVDTGELPAAAESTDPAESVGTDELVAAAESSDAAAESPDAADSSEPVATDSSEPVATDSGEPDDDAAADSSVSPAVVPISETPKETGESSAETIDEPADHDEVPKFTLPKPVLVPLIAVCLGLLCTLLGFAILPSGDSGPGPRTNSTAGSGSASEPKSTTDDSDETRASDGSGGSTSADPAHGADTDAPSSRDEDRDTDSDTSPRPGDKASELPADSPGSSGTDAPSKSSDSDDPTAPDEPSAPDEPESPDSPSQPESPDEPETPSEPDPTEDPGTPSEPDPTEDPGTPSEPESPEEPETPSEPESPSDPGAPSEPESPGTP